MDTNELEDDTFRTPVASEADIFEEPRKQKPIAQNSPLNTSTAAPQSEIALSARSRCAIDAETSKNAETNATVTSKSDANASVSKFPRIKSPATGCVAKNINDVWNDENFSVNPDNFEEDVLRKEPVHIFYAVMHFCNTVLGTGMLSLPHSILIAGAIPGGMLLIILALLVDWTVMLLIDAAKNQHVLTYEDLAKKAFGGRFRVIVSITQLLFAFGGMCAYLVIIADTVNSMIGLERGTEVANRYRAVSMWLSGLVLVFLSLPKNSSLLTTLTTFGFTAILLLTGSLLVCSSQQKGTGFRLWDGEHPFRAIGIISFVYVCHHGTFKVYRGHGAPSVEKFAQTTHSSMVVSAVICVIFAICGYFAFGDKTQGNILNNLSYKSNPLLLGIAHACVLASISSTFPLECSVARDVISYYVPQLRQPFKAFVTTLLLFVTAAIISSLTDNLASVLAVTGSISANFLAYVFPPLISLRMQQNESKVLCYTSVFFGVVASALAVV